MLTKKDERAISISISTRALAFSVNSPVANIMPNAARVIRRAIVSSMVIIIV